MASHKANINLRKELLAEYKRLSKRADSRLRALENLSNEPGFENVKKFAYERAMKDIRSWSGEDVKRFNRDMSVDTNANSLKRRINDVKRFLNSSTSTKTDILKNYQSRADKINKFTGGKTNFKWQDLANVFEHAKENKWYEDGGKTYLIAVDYMKNNEDSLIESLEQEKNIIVRTGNRKANEMIKDIIKEKGFNFTDLY